MPGFSRFPGYDAVAQFLEDVSKASKAAGMSAGAAPGPPSPATANTSPDPTPSTYITSYGRQTSVICGGSPNPKTVAASVQQALASYARAGIGSWPYVAACLGWPVRASERYFGPWNTPTPAVLVVGNRHDPATPYSSSARVASELFDGHLLTVHGFGHTELLNPSRCARHLIAAYLIDGQVPADGTTGSQDDDPPFPQ